MVSKLQSWLDKGFTLGDRLKARPAVDREIEPATLERKIARGDLAQELRLKYYPSIEVELDRLYAGTYRGSLQELERKMFLMGFRNNPTSYVEVLDDYGPDDGSYAQHVVKEDSSLPSLNVDRPLGTPALWRRLKLQTHASVFQEGDEIHILAHREPSAILQPARHLAIDKADARIGIREFREAWVDEFGESLPQPL